MKNFNNRQLHLLGYLVAFLPLLLMLVLFKSKIFNTMSVFYLGSLVLILIMDILRVFYFKININKMFMTEFINVALLGLISFYYMNNGEVPFMKLLLIWASIVAIRDGNRQAIVPQDSSKAGIMSGYSKPIYQRSQRMLGRGQFAMGVLGLIVAILVPNEYAFHAFAAYLFLLYVGSFYWIYKSGKIAG